jgi:hypothetical protein
MILDHPCRPLILESKSLEILRRHVAIKEVVVAAETEARIVGGITQDDATPGALFLEAVKACAD